MPMPSNTNCQAQLLRNVVRELGFQTLTTSNTYTFIYIINWFYWWNGSINKKDERGSYINYNI